MLFRILIAFIVSVIVSPHPAGADPSQREGVQFRRLADNVWMHTSFRNLRNHGPFPANGLIVMDGSETILIDAGWTDTDAGAVLDWAEHELGHAVTRAYFTHAHVDKMGGVGEIRRRGIATFATALSNELAVENGLMPTEFVLELEAGSEPVAVGPVRFFYPGPGHSPDNIVANVDDQGILFGGCLIRPANSRSLGNILDASISNWDVAVIRVGERFPDSTVVVPTHGPPAGRELLTATTRLARGAAGK